MSNSPYLGHLRNEYSSSQLSFLDMFPLEIDYNASSFEALSYSFSATGIPESLCSPLESWEFFCPQVQQSSTNSTPPNTIGLEEGVGLSPAFGPDIAVPNALMRDRKGNLCQEQTSQPQKPTAKRQGLVEIGTILSNGNAGNDRYKCNDPSCADITFGRVADLKRHYATRHAVARPQHWCPVIGCRRSQDGDGGNEGFVRKDKLKDHMKQAHGLMDLRMEA